MTAPERDELLDRLTPSCCATDRATVRHLTTRLRVPDMGLGRLALTLCGIQAMDQARLAWIRELRPSNARRSPVPTIADLPLCRSCMGQAVRLGLRLPAGSGGVS